MEAGGQMHTEHLTSKTYIPVPFQKMAGWFRTRLHILRKENFSNMGSRKTVLCV